MSGGVEVCRVRVIGVGFGHVPDAEILTRTEIRRFLTDGQSTAALDAQEAAMSAFVRELQVGDSVLMPDPLCDEVVVIAGGRVAVRGTPEELLRVTGKASLEDAFVAATGGELSV